MSDAPQTLPEAPSGAAPTPIVVVQAPITYTAEQEAAFDAIPSRAVIEDGTKNPRYNPRMDPGSDKWDPHAYFAAEEQIKVFVHVDPESPDTQVFGMSINGFELPCYPGHAQWMPSSFAELLKQRNQKLDVLGRRLVNEDGEGEGKVTLSVAGEMVKPGARIKQFQHLVAV